MHKYKEEERHQQLLFIIRVNWEKNGSKDQHVLEARGEQKEKLRKLSESKKKECYGRVTVLLQSVSNKIRKETQIFKEHVLRKHLLFR